MTPLSSSNAQIPPIAAGWSNREWRLHADGLEHRDTGYFIERETLCSRRSDGLWAWPLHVAEKSWCRQGPFHEAFCAALDRFGHEADASLAQSFTAAFGPRPEPVGREDFLSLNELLRPAPKTRTAPPSPGQARDTRATRHGHGATSDRTGHRALADLDV